MAIENMDLVDLKSAILNIKGFDVYFIQEIAVNVTEMFRDPEFYNSLKENVLTYLKSYPQVRVWSAGCATGEEAYSLAILLKDSDLLSRSFVYGTDISARALEIAKKGIYSANRIKNYTKNYNLVTTQSDFADHFTAMYDNTIINNEYRNKILFSSHNLASDQVFNEFQLICCRNVMIYFDKELQAKVLHLFYESLSLFGFLCLGSKETLYGHKISQYFKKIDGVQNIYQKIK